MSQFDKKTESKAAERYPFKYIDSEPTWMDVPRYNGRQELARCDFTAGRISAKESLEILAKAVSFYSGEFLVQSNSVAGDAIAAVKARGDWPLEESK